MPLKESEIAQKIREEHEIMKQEMKKLKKMMNAHVSLEGFPKGRLDFLWLLRDFKNDLHKHFDMEEEGGFMSEVVKLAPQNLNAVNRLEAEHQAMIDDLDEVLRDLKALHEKNDQKLEKIREQVDNFFSLLESHEAAEGDLIESTYLQDEGMAD